MTFVLLPRFNKPESECKSIVDKILFSLKNGHKLKSVPRSFREKEFKEIFEVAKISNFTTVELAKYEAAMIHEYDYKASIDYAKKEGVGIGVMKIAKNMLAKGFSVADVLKATNLPREQVRALRQA
jgi:predicted transposase/invertase (TIGR01784 family)